MRITSLLRLVLCGFVTGVVWFLLSAVLLSLFASDFLISVQRGGTYAMRGSLFFFGIDLLMGLWTIWLYSVIAPKYGAGAKTAAIAGLAWWLIKSLQSAKWVGLGFIPQGQILAPAVTSLIGAVAAAVVGAWLYQRIEMPAAEALSSG